MKLNRVLILYKKLEPVTHPTRPASRRRRSRRHVHNETLAAVITTVKRLGLTVRTVERSRFTRGIRADLIVTVGGDGTVLTATHLAGRTPILGVNSRPGKSVGFHCAATKTTFPHFLKKVLAGKIKPQRLPLLAATIDGQTLKFFALNDILFASHRPFDLVSYRLQVGKKTEWQRGSGVWMCAGPGSTAGFASAGGRPAPLGSAKLCFLVREPCPFPGRRYHLLTGKLSRNEQITISGDGKGGLVCLDGPGLVVPLKAGQRLTVRIASQPAFIFHCL